MTRRVLTFIASAFVAAVVVASFTIMQSPGTARLKKADATRSDDLASIRMAVRSYYTAEGRLPESLAPLTDRLASNRFRDPLTQQPYEYRILDPGHFELCATFALEAPLDRGMRYFEGGDEVDLGIHGPGRQCFRIAAEPPVTNPPPR
ncbi:MAG TPA: hypothetical protein VFP10_05055 [Candidatus Eisenbacteria bacterium]|nr:hypothetical protein [Candidatus Eisenbacteria bacterium]